MPNNEEATLVINEDCQGRTQEYWSASAQDVEGGYVLANAGSKREAELILQSRLKERNAFLQSSPAEQLTTIVEKDRILSDDMERAIRLIHKLLSQPQKSNEEILKEQCKELFAACKGILEANKCNGTRMMGAEYKAMEVLRDLVHKHEMSTGM